MKVDVVALGLRLTAALFLFSLTVGALFLIGSAQSFFESTLQTLFLTLRVLTWGGLLVCLILLLPWTLKQRGRLLAVFVLAAGFAAVYFLSLLWGSWVYPGVTAW